MTAGRPKTGRLAAFQHPAPSLAQIEAGIGSQADERSLAAQVERLREELMTVQEEVSGLSERLDFTEKLLMRAPTKATPIRPASPMARGARGSGL